MEQIKKINEEIKSLKIKLEDTKGRPCEVYSRITGYYRNVSSWNPGKRVEFDQRLTFDESILGLKEIG